MISKSFLFVFLIATLFGGFRASFFNYEELKHINYGIEILQKPVLLSDSPNGNEQDVGVKVNVASIHGQQYVCTYRQIEPLLGEEDDLKTSHTSVVSLLQPLEDNCFKTRRQWWTYEFCYGKYVLQYHEENGKKQEPSVTLGYYQSDFDWEIEDNPERKRHLNSYHSQKYVNGTKCDLTGKPRKVEVRISCGDEFLGDFLSGVEEPETCSYIIHFQTSRVCKHPYLQPKNQKFTVPISCSPALTQEEYGYYQRKVMFDAGPTTEELILMDGKLVPQVESPKSNHKNLSPGSAGGKLTEAASLKPFQDLTMDAILDSMITEVNSAFQKEGLGVSDITSVDADWTMLDDPEMWQELMEEIQDTAPVTNVKDILKHADMIRKEFQDKLGEATEEAEEETGIKLDKNTDDGGLRKEVDQTALKLVRELMKTTKEMHEKNELLRVKTRALKESQKRLEAENKRKQESLTNLIKAFKGENIQGDADGIEVGEQQQQQQQQQQQPEEDDGEDISLGTMAVEEEAGGRMREVVDISLGTKAVEEAARRRMREVDEEEEYELYDDYDEEEDEDDEEEDVEEDENGLRMKKVHGLKDGDEDEPGLDPDPDLTEMNIQEKPASSKTSRKDHSSTATSLDDDDDDVPIGEKLEIRIIGKGFFDSEDQRGHITQEDSEKDQHKVVIAILAPSDRANQEKQKQLSLESGYNFSLKNRKNKKNNN